MSRSLSVHAIILRTIDIGEADRFCILFTKEYGRMAARAKSVRKMTSRLGGILLPLRCVRLELHQSDHSLTITSGQIDGEAEAFREYGSVLSLQQGIELLLALTQDEEPLEDVFDLLQQFVGASAYSTSTLLAAFQLRLLHLLGVLPAVRDDMRFRNLDPVSQTFIERCVTETNLHALAATPCGASTRHFLQAITLDQISTPLRSMSLNR